MTSGSPHSYNTTTTHQEHSGPCHSRELLKLVCKPGDRPRDRVLSNTAVLYVYLVSVSKAFEFSAFFGVVIDTGVK